MKDDMDDEELESFMNLQTHHIYVSEEDYEELLKILQEEELTLIKREHNGT